MHIPLIRRVASAALVGAAALAMLAGTAAASVTPAPVATNSLPVWTPLTLQNGWTTSPDTARNAAASVVSGVVHLKGAIGTPGTNPVPFTLPSAFRPSATVYVPVDMCSATNGRLVIEHNGVVTVEAETTFANAKCFTSLDGVTYAKNATGYTAVSLLNGWTNTPFSTRNAAVKVIGGVVQFEGAIATSGTNDVPFVLPPGFVPNSPVYVAVDMCNATNGRLIIDTSGNVTVQPESNFGNAQCLTSLEGASFPLNAKGYTALGLQNGWVNSVYSARNAAAKNINGIVHLEGAIGSGTNGLASFTLPPAFIPPVTVYVKVDMCNATNGRLQIDPSGSVFVVAESDFSNAQCLTSLEGVSYAL